MRRCLILQKCNLHCRRKITTAILTDRSQLHPLFLTVSFKRNQFWKSELISPSQSTRFLLSAIFYSPLTPPASQHYITSHKSCTVKRRSPSKVFVFSLFWIALYVLVMRSTQVSIRTQKHMLTCIVLFHIATCF